MVVFNNILIKYWIYLLRIILLFGFFYFRGCLKLYYVCMFFFVCVYWLNNVFDFDYFYIFVCFYYGICVGKFYVEMCLLKSSYVFY